MTNFRFVILFSLCATNTVVNAQTAPDVLNDPTWQFVWGDNFDVGPLNTAIWSPLDEYQQSGADLVFLAENAVVTGGDLVLTFKKDQYYYCMDLDHCGEQAIDGQPYTHTAAYVRTTPAYMHKYGYIEARIWVEYGYGLNPAFWTFNQNSLINKSEIDIFEMRQGFFDTHNQITTNLHYSFDDTSTIVDETSPVPADTYKEHIIGDYTGGYKTYAIEWSPTKITWYVDGVEVRFYPNPINPDPPHEIQDVVRMLFTLGAEDNYVIGASTPPIVNMRISDFNWYQRQSDCNIVNTCAYVFNQHPVYVKKSITIGGGSCSNIQPVGSVVYLVATDFVELNSTFEVPLGAELNIDIADDCY